MVLFYKNISGYHEAGVGVKQVQLGTFALIIDKVFWKGKKNLLHCGLFPVVRKYEPWVIAPDAMSRLGCVRRNLLNQERFHLREYTEDL